MSDATLCIDFTTCVNLYQDYIKQYIKDRNANVNVSAVGTETKKNSKCKPGIVEDQYYTHAKYQKLTANQKLTLKNLHNACEHKKKKPKADSSARLSHNIATLAAALAKDKGVPMPSNCNNPALIHQGKGKQK